MEGIALTGAWVDQEKGLLSLIVLEMGVSSRLVRATCSKGEPVVVMGPTGAPTEIPEGENVLLLGGGLGNAVLFSIAQGAARARQPVIYFAGYKKGEDLFKREEIEAATDQVIWSTDTGAAIAPRPAAGRALPRQHRPGDARLPGGRARRRRSCRSPTVDRIIAIGSDRMMAAVKAARHGVLAPYLKPTTSASAASTRRCSA